MRPLAFIFCLLLCLSGCYSVPHKGELFTAAVIKTVTMEDLLPSPRNMLYNALLQGISVEEVRQHRLLVVSCVPDKGTRSYSTSYLALAPQELDDLLAWDYIEAEPGVPIGEQGPLTRILRRVKKPAPGELATVLGRTEVLCRNDPETQLIHAKVDYFISPMELLRAEWQARTPLRGLYEADIRAGRIIMVTCALAEETNSLTWYARIPESFAIINDPSADRTKQIVEVRAGRPEIDWYGGVAGPLSRLTRYAEENTAKEHWPIELSAVVRRLPSAPDGYTHLGTPYCGRGKSP